MPAPLEIGGVTVPAGVICIVDDDASLARALQRLLHASGFRALTFRSGEAFLGALPSPAPRCVVLDVHLGGLNGFQVHETLASRGTTIPTIFITAHDDAATRERALRTGAGAYLPKPFDEDSLISAIRSAIARD